MLGAEVGMHVLITGASSGIGRTLALEWAGRGAKLSLAARREDRLRALAEEVGGAAVLVADLSQPGVAAELVARAEAELGPVDVLVNNAGIQYVEAFEGVSPERAERLIQVDLIAPLILAQTAAASMIPRGTGTIINIASMAGITPTPGMTHYVAAKAGLGAASEALRHELEPKGVKVLTVYPGPIETEMEAAARANLEEGIGQRLAVSESPEAFARALFRALDKRSVRLIRPRTYVVGWHLRNLASWVVAKLSPALAQEGA